MLLALVAQKPTQLWFTFAGDDLKRGFIFSTESMYLLIAVFVVVEAIIFFLPNVNQPNYDLISALKVAHDMGQNNTSAPPKVSALGTNYLTGTSCNDENTTVVEISYYEYGGATDKRVCAK